MAEAVLEIYEQFITPPETNLHPQRVVIFGILCIAEPSLPTGSARQIKG